MSLGLNNTRMANQCEVFLFVFVLILLGAESTGPGGRGQICRSDQNTKCTWWAIYRSVEGVCPQLQLDVYYDWWLRSSKSSWLM